MGQSWSLSFPSSDSPHKSLDIKPGEEGIYILFIVSTGSTGRSTLVFDVGAPLKNTSLKIAKRLLRDRVLRLVKGER